MKKEYYIYEDLETKEEVFRAIESLIENEDLDDFDNVDYQKSWFYKKHFALIDYIHEDYYDDFNYLYNEKFLDYEKLLGE